MPRISYSAAGLNNTLLEVDALRFSLLESTNLDLSHARQDHRGSPVLGIRIGGDSGSSGHTAPASEGSLHGRSNWAPSRSLIGGLTVVF